MMTPINPRLDRLLDEVAVELAREFAGIFDAATVRRQVYAAIEMLPEPKVDAFRHIFARRFARELLRAAARWNGSLPSSRPQLLFVCIQNAGRSQMAAAFANELGKGRVDALSAGSDPANEVHPNVAAAMKEVGIGLEDAYPKRITDEFVQGADIVVTMGCGDACPVFVGKRYEDWKLPDVSGASIAEVRKVRDQIQERVTRLLAEIAPA